MIEVLAPGLLTTVQDARGRLNLGRFGVATGGALDSSAAVEANLLVGNPPDAALLEITLVGPTLEFSIETAVAISGADLNATLDRQPLKPHWSYRVRSGSVLSFGERQRGARAYLAVADGLQLPPVLGSPAADLRGGFSGLAGRALRAGDTLPIRHVPDVVSRCGRSLTHGCATSGPLRILPGPHLDHFAPGAFDWLCQQSWQITDQADRIGYRLSGPPLRHVRPPEVVSLGLPVGAIQVPGDGQPIVLLADHQPTGGYPVLACVIRADLGRLAQRVPGEEVTFTPTTLPQAREALRLRYTALQSMENDDAVWSAIRLAGFGIVN